MYRTFAIFLVVLIMAIPALGVLPKYSLADFDNCSNYGKVQTFGSVFQNYEKAEYLGGLLVMHFAFNPLVTNHSLSTVVHYLDSGCNDALAAAQQWFFSLPANVTNFSFRFVTARSYQIFDDDTGQPINCEKCSAQFDTGDLPSGLYKAAFSLGWGDFQTSLFSTAQFITKSILSHPPVLIVPGITGTQLYQGSTLLWPNIGKMANPFDSDDFLDPLGFDRNLAPLDLGVRSGSVIRVIDPLLTGDKKFDYADGLIKQFSLAGYKEDKDLFTFPYDWRLSVADNALQLKGMVQLILNQTHSDKVDVVAHSTGGLVVKKYIADNENHHLGKAVFVAIPNLGAPKATKTLLAGDDLGVPGLAEAEIKKIGQNMPLLYELSPSAQYVDKAGKYLSLVQRQGLFGVSRSDLDYQQTKNYLVNQKGLNPLGVANLEQSSGLASLDVEQHNVDAYNIIGCKSATIGSITERSSGYSLGFVNGDGTVPLVSSSVLATPGGHSYYVTKVKHPNLLSADGPRQAIVKIISSDSSVEIPNNTKQDPAGCKMSGKLISIFSPVDINVVDALGNQQTEIPGSSFETANDHKFVFLPTDEDQSYKVNLAGTGNGSFTIRIDSINNDKVESTSAYYDLPVNLGEQGALNITGSTALEFNDVTYKPNVISPEEVNDLTPPELQVNFDPKQNDFVFKATDNLSGPLTITKDQNKTTARDRNGNLTEGYYEKRKIGQQNIFKFTKIIYNNQEFILSDNELRIVNKNVQEFDNLPETSVRLITNEHQAVLVGGNNQSLISQKTAANYRIELATNHGKLQYSLIPF